MQLNHIHCFYDQAHRVSDVSSSNEFIFRRHDACLLHEKTCLSSLSTGTASIQNKFTRNFTEIPIGVLMHVFSYLDACSLTSLAQTCSYLNEVSSDHLLWMRLLIKDSCHWSVLGHLSYPKVYHDVHTELSAKQIYRACYCKRSSQPQRSFTYPITTRLRSLVRRLQGHVPRMLVFGSGLESLPFVRTLMWENTSPYKPIGLSPGKDGVGSGVCVQHRERALNLVTLYKATKAERGQGLVNKLLNSSSDGQLAPSVQELCAQADGFILVVDSTQQGDYADDARLMSSMLSYGASPSPLLVLALRLSEGDPHLPPVHLAQRLKMELVTHPWQVRSLVVETYCGMVDGVDWLLRAGQ